MEMRDCNKETIWWRGWSQQEGRQGKEKVIRINMI
jgi:hypothetical protein